ELDPPPAPTVSVSPALNETVPDPESVLKLCENPLKPTSPPALTVSAVLPPKAVELPANNGPPLTTVAPVDELFPDRTRAPAPFFVKDPDPSIAPERVALDPDPITSTAPPPAPSVIARGVKNELLLMPSVPPVVASPRNIGALFGTNGPKNPDT